MAGPLMRAGDVDLVVVGADRIAANGDTANKIGTYAVAVLAREHSIPFYVAAPLSTIDLDTPDGARHPDRGAQRARGDAHRHVAADARRRAHPQPGLRRDAAPLITGIITERGIFARALHESLEARAVEAACRAEPC